jgi:protocatechuate 3,4-dioxygenase beta subunit
LPEGNALSYNSHMRFQLPLLLFSFFWAGLLLATAAGQERSCRLTPADALGPFYQPGAPVRAKVGEGYLLEGQALSAADCRPLPNAVIEFWLAGPLGSYDDDHRATVYAGLEGNYRFESNFPPPYGTRPPHIHLRVTAPGHQELITQHYPQPATESARFELVLAPANGRASPGR